MIPRCHFTGNTIFSETREVFQLRKCFPNGHFQSKITKSQVFQFTPVPITRRSRWVSGGGGGPPRAAHRRPALRTALSPPPPRTPLSGGSGQAARPLWRRESRAACVGEGAAAATPFTVRAYRLPTPARKLTEAHSHCPRQGAMDDPLARMGDVPLWCRSQGNF
eukprot:gene24395-biopygen23894